MMRNIEYLSLMAEWMDETRLVRDGQFDARDDELDYWAKHARESNGSILELACGSGKVLIPLLERGFDVCGVDNSEAMLERCRVVCKERNVEAKLYNQSVQKIDIPYSFGLIFGNSGFLSLFVQDEDIRSTMESVMRQLRPGGRFVCTFEQATEGNLQWCKGDPNWTGDYFRAPNGTLYVTRSMHKDYTSVPNAWEHLLIIEKYVDGKLVESEANQRLGRFFSVEEVVRSFESAGFEGTQAFDGFTGKPPSKDGALIAVVAHKLA